MSVVRAWNALPQALRASLTAGATVVSPNKRLARRLVALYDETQRAAGCVVWPAATVVPWGAWLELLWLDALASDDLGEPPRLLGTVHTAHLWARIVARDAMPLIDEAGIAVLAADAWSLAHGWGSGGPSWRAWSGGDDDCAAFARWAEDYGRDLTRKKGLDAAQLPDWLARNAPGVAPWRGADVMLAGFIEFAPQQQRLLAALSAAGMRITREGAVRDTPGVTLRATAATPTDEVVQALQWARERAVADPGAALCIAIEDFTSRTVEVRALAEDVLCPDLQWPGREGSARPYTLSLGSAASDVPLIAAALDLIALLHAPLPAARVAALLRSPYLSVAPDGWLGRARLEQDWNRESRREVTFDDALTALGAVDRALFDRWRIARDGRRIPAQAAPRQWADTWRNWLAALGWPGERSLSSAEWQAHVAWDDLLAQFATLSLVAPQLPAGEAARELFALAQGHVFQEESAGAPIAIMGLLEAASLPVDALWVAGLAAERWPPAPQPNPLLALAWQRECNVPRSTALRELEYGEALIKQWTRGAAEVVFSFARSADDHVRSASSLLPDAPMLPERAAMPTTAHMQFLSVPARETLSDDEAPSLARGSLVKGGAALIEAQSDCPFRAFALFRLGADAWPTPDEGLSAKERGMLIHAAFVEFWRDVQDHARFVALSSTALATRIDAAVAAAVKTIPAARWRRVPSAVRAGEAGRIAAIVRAWLDGYERVRPPFVVAETEVKRRLVLEGLELELRVDRIDVLAEGGLAILDYKSGAAKPPAKWFDARPQAPQLGLYVLAQQALAVSPSVRAVAYAQLKPGEIRPLGIAADAGAWPVLVMPSGLGAAALPDWSAVEMHWQQSLGALAVEVREGHASVSPRDARATCRNCGLQPLCRIGALSIEAREENGDA